MSKSLRLINSKLDYTLLFVSFYSKVNYFMILAIKNMLNEFVSGVRI